MWIFWFWVLPLGNGLWIGSEYGLPILDYTIHILKHVLV